MVSDASPLTGMSCWISTVMSYLALWAIFATPASARTGAKCGAYLLLRQLLRAVVGEGT